MRPTVTHALVVALILLTLPVGSASQEAPLPDSGADYHIGVGDKLQIITWKEPDFSREEIVVRLDGKISFPLINDVVAAGKTPAQLKAELENQLKDFVANPNVTVSLREGTSNHFYVLGEVMNTGEYPLTKNLTVLQAFAVAGGFTEWAAKKEIILLRRENGADTVYRINYRDILKGKDFSQNIQIRANDTIIVP